ncbi:MAG: glycosyltransferase [Dictyoglomaceae bacterium]|nr:glycosyltransferase [Dictyoglomaceae bacterium]
MKITVNVISEALAWDVKGQGVYTASLSLVEALRRKEELEVSINGKGLYDIAHLHTPGPYAVSKGMISGRRLVISAHVIPASLIGSLVLVNVWLPFFTQYLKYYYNLADCVIAVSPKVKEELEIFGVKAPIYFVPNPVNLNKFYPSIEKKKRIREKLGISTSDFVALGSGQIQPRKGIDTFIEVARKLPDVKFVWVGGQPFSVFTAGFIELQEKIKNAPSNVIFTGIVPYEEMPDYYNLGDVFFFPSYQENLPMAVLEASSCGLPLLLRDILEYKEPFGGFFIPAKNDGEFLNYLLKLKNNRDFYIEYKNKALRLAQNYNLDNVANMLLEIYKEVLKNPPRYKRNWITLEKLREEGKRIWKYLGHPNIKRRRESSKWIE